jgi:hypothetical protein
MLTIFACPKPFTDPHIAIIQRNAITSWTLLKPKPEIILFADEPGTAEICQELGLRHVPEVARNEYGTPLVNSLFHKAQVAATYRLLCYVNADIILTSRFMEAAVRAATFARPFLMCGRRWDLPVDSPLKFGETWEEELMTRVAREGRLDPSVGIDYFLFQRQLWGEIPPFAIGRFFWDNWLLYEARRKGAWLIDATEAVWAIHQRHGYQGSDFNSQEELWGSPESRRNLKLSGGPLHLYGLTEATHRLDSSGLRRWLPGTLKYKVIYQQWIMSVWYPFLALTHPLRHPLAYLTRVIMCRRKEGVGHSATTEPRRTCHVL